MFKERNLDLKRLGETAFDGIQPQRGQLFAIKGGPFKSFDIDSSITTRDYVETEGEENTMA